MKSGFDRRIYTAKGFFSDIRYLLHHTAHIARAMRRGQVSRVFMEKIMTVVTAVNGCIYCSWFHAQQAVSSGINQEELKNLFGLQFRADATEFELPGLLYAQHYAETNRNPKVEMVERLVASYGNRTAQDIELFIRMIFFGNLSGNTWDAVLSRFKGNPAENSNIAFELMFFVTAAPAMIPLMFLVKGSGSRRRQHSNFGLSS